VPTILTSTDLAEVASARRICVDAHLAQTLLVKRDRQASFASQSAPPIEWHDSC
jgi:hypothetical protein